MTDSTEDRTPADRIDGRPATGGGFRAALAISRAEIRSEYHRRTATRRKRVLLLVGVIAYLPAIGLFLLGAHRAGEIARAAESSALLGLARWTLPLALLMGIANGAFLLTDDVVSFEARPLVLSSVPDRTVALGLLGAICWQLTLVIGLPLAALFVAFGVGAESVLAGVLGWASTILLLLATCLIGIAVGLFGRIALLHTPLSTAARELYGTVAKVMILVGFGAVGAIGGAMLGESEAESVGINTIAPSGPPPVPVGYVADWLFVATALVDGLGVAALTSGAVILASIPIATAAIVHAAPRVWYADPARPDRDDSDATDLGAATPDHHSFLDGGRIPGSGRIGVVVDGLVRRGARQPQRFAYLAYHLFVPVIFGTSALISSDVGLATVLGGSAVILGLWFAGAVFCLNPLGEEGTMLGQLVLADIDPQSLVRARLLAGTLVGTPLVAVGMGALVAGGLAPPRAAVLCGYWMALVPASAGMALGVGTLLPGTETRELLDAIEVRAPELIAVIYHGMLVVLLAIGGWVLTGGAVEGLTLWGLAGTLGVVIIALGHGGYRFAVSGLADHGRPHRPDRVFAVELSIGLALAGLLLSQLVGLAVTLFLDLDGFAGFVSGFLGQYAGWTTVVAAFLLVTGRTGYLDVDGLSRRDVRETAVVTTVLLGIWGVVIAIVSVFELPFTGHELSGVGSGVGELAVLIALIFLVNAPVEEALFRNVIQKRLGSALESRLALGVAALVFGLIHVPFYLNGGVLGAVIPILLVTVAGAGFGIVYVRTQNLVAATLSHAVYNAVQVGLVVTLRV